MFLCDVNVVGLPAVVGSEGGATGAEIFCTVGVEKCCVEGVGVFGTVAVEVGCTGAGAER